MMHPTKLGPYELQTVIGRGGMGTVFKAKHEFTGELVAIKSLTPGHSDDTHFRNRFESEIDALLKLDHPNIVRLLSYGQEQGILFFAMELVEGRSLFQALREKRRFEWQEVLVVARDVARGLRHAHDRGIIHRDLKPGNLLQDTEGNIKITDFGIAKLFGKSNDTRDNVLGTIDFMSPEQALGRPVTVRSDLYSLGVVLYALLCGKPPSAGESIEESLRNLTRVAIPRIRTILPNVPPPVDDLLAELVAKKPEKRLPTALALLKRLETVEQELVNFSEAQTDCLAPTKAIDPKATFQLSNPTKLNPATGPKTRKADAIQPTVDESAAKKSASPKKSATPKSPVNTVAANATVAQPDEELKLAAEPEPPKPVHDYFSPVTQQQRLKHLLGDDPEPTHSSRGWFLLLLLLIAVVSGTVYAVYQVTRPPSAEVLFAKIEAEASAPERVRDEISQFLKYYADDERAPQIEQLQKYNDSLALYKRMSVRRNAPGTNRLSLVEREFVDTVDTSFDNPAVGYKKLQAFIRLNDTGENISAEVEPLVTAAKHFTEKVKNDARRQIHWDRQRIDDALTRADQNPAERRELLEAVILLYADIDWARDLVDEARRFLREYE